MSYKELVTSGIKRIRNKYNLTQEQFAERICMSVQGYRNIEHSKYLPTAETIDKICTEFNISPIELLLPEEKIDEFNINSIINLKLRACTLEKLVRINSMIDLM